MAKNKTAQTENTQKEITLQDWAQLTTEQQETLKETLLKSTFGIGGEHFSTFPTVLDNKINTWVETEYQISKLPKRVQAGTFKEWEPNGTIQILPVEKGNKVYYLTIIKPNKQLKMDLWELNKEAKKPFLEYTTYNKMGTLTFGKNHFHILNGYTNKNKAFNQAKALGKLFQLGTDFQTLELQKELQQNYLKLELLDGNWVLQEISKNTQKPITGKTFQNIEDYLGRAQHKDIKTNYMELLQKI